VSSVFLVLTKIRGYQ